MKKVELLAPAGSFEALKAAVNNGADAVYLGGSNFSARAFADNFDYPRIKEAVEYCHLRNVKVFVTMNTLLNEFEIERAIKDARYYHSIGVDALLIQDLGFYYLLSKELSDMEIHASTQMHIHDIDGVRAAKRMGFKRVVVARESSLDFIREACKEDIEVECFVHGAICVSYSGQCLLSSSLKKRSANKGVCAQCCRLRYGLYKDGAEIKTDTEYLLSPNDMCLIDHIPELLEAGVACLKIEGRMKSPAYVAYVTKMYRKAIDAYYAKRRFEMSEEELENMKMLFNRGFTDSYLLRDGKDIFGNKRPNHMGIAIGKVLYVKRGIAYIRLDRAIEQFDGIRILGQKEDTGLIINRLYKNGLLVSKADAGDVIGVEVKDFVSKDALVLLTQNHSLEESILNYELKRIPVSLNIQIRPNNKPIIKSIVDGRRVNYVAEITAQEALNKPLDEETVIRQFSKCKDTVYSTDSIRVELTDCFLPISALNSIRRSFFEYLDNKRLEFKRDFHFEAPLTGEKNKLQEPEFSTFENDFYLDPIIRNHPFDYKPKMIMSTVASLFKEAEVKIAGLNMNIANSYALEFVLKNGFSNAILSSELDVYGITALVKNYQERNGLEFKPYVYKEGKRTLMYTRRDPFAKYDIEEGNYTLSDGTKELEIRRYCDHTELVEDFVSEAFDEVSAICNCIYIGDGNLL